MTPLLLNVDQAAQALAISRRALYRLIDNGTIPVVRIGASVRIPTDTLAEFVEQLKAAS